MANANVPAQGGRGGGGGAPNQPPAADQRFNWPAKASVIGTHVKRVDGPDKVSGRARYTFDVNRPGMARQLSAGIVENIVDVTPSAIQFVDDGKAITVNTTNLRLAVEKELSHDPTCGGKQWFHPLASVAGAEMGQTAENAFLGASLGTKWSDPNKRSAFFGTFAY